jgi:hypothetical protein
MGRRQRYRAKSPLDTLVSRFKEMTYTDTLQALNTAKKAFATAKQILDSAADFSYEAAIAAWQYLRPALLVLAALAIVSGFRCYELGQAFRVWCDRLVEDSTEKPHQLLLAPAACTGYLMPAKPDFSIRTLKAMARARHIKRYGEMNKADLIKALGL